MSASIMSGGFLMHIYVLEHLSLSLFFVLLISMSSLGDGFINLTERVDFIYTKISFKKIELNSKKQQQECQAKKKKENV